MNYSSTVSGMGPQQEGPWRASCLAIQTQHWVVWYNTQPNAFNFSLLKSESSLMLILTHFTYHILVGPIHLLGNFEYLAVILKDFCKHRHLCFEVCESNYWTCLVTHIALICNYVILNVCHCFSETTDIKKLFYLNVKSTWGFQEERKNCLNFISLWPLQEKIIYLKESTTSNILLSNKQWILLWLAFFKQLTQTTTVGWVKIV